MPCMATYTVIPKVDDTGFHVAIVGSDGVRQTILGFETGADAEAWISRDKWLDAADRHGTPHEPTPSQRGAAPDAVRWDRSASIRSFRVGVDRAAA
jgi:hypothetical protein